MYSFYKKYLKKLIATFLSIKSTLLIARLTVKFTKYKQKYLHNNADHKAKNKDQMLVKSDQFSCYMSQQFNKKYCWHILICLSFFSQIIFL